MKKRNAWLIFISFIVVLALAIVFINTCLFSSSVTSQTTESEATEITEITVEVRYMELPELSYIENSVFITHYLPEQDNRNIRNYSILYDTVQKVSYWVAYPLHEIYLGNSGRSEAWNYDPQVARHLQPRARTGQDLTEGINCPAQIGRTVVQEV